MRAGEAPEFQEPISDFPVSRMRRRKSMTMKWNEPVRIEAPISGDVQVNGPFEALAVLLDEWPDLRGPGYVRARSLCRAAVAGRKDAEEAREIFITAAREANIIH
jgi:hypothetical protein